MMKAVIMAGGKGTRLQPYSALLPKPLMPLGEMPILEVLLLQLRAAGVTDVILVVNHLRHLIEAYFGNGNRLGLNISYHFEDHPLGTAGSIAAILDEVSPSFLLANGDLLTTLSIPNLVKSHASSESAATIGVYEREVKIDFGLIEVDTAMRMVAYREKPSYKHLVSMGIYVLEAKAVRQHVTIGEYLDMPNLILKMKDNGKQINCFQEDCFWLDIGRPDDFALAQKLVEEDPARFVRAL
jgi:NDP-mannose synthase